MDKDSGSRKAKKDRPEGKKKGTFGARSSTVQPEILYAALGLFVFLLLIAIWGIASTGRVLPHYPARDQSEGQ